MHGKNVDVIRDKDWNGSSLVVLLLLLVFPRHPFQKHRANEGLFFIRDGNNIFVVFIGTHKLERVWEDVHLKIIIIVLENYVRANASSSFKEDDEEEHD